MTPEQFFDAFGYLADAPNGVQKLRELILQLAVRGKLVPQDPADEQAAKLLERIRTEKARLVKEKKIRKADPLPPVTAEEASYELPQGWEWSRLAEVGVINPVNAVSDDSPASFLPMAAISEKYGVPISPEVRAWKDIKKGFTHFGENDVVLAKITPCFQNGKSAVVRGLENGVGAGTTELHVFRPVGATISSDFILIYLKTPSFINDGIPKMTGSAGQKRVPKEYFSFNPFPLPPLAEQTRIVAKVDQLMTLCDELEARQQKSQKKLLRLNNAALDRLTCASGADDFAAAWELVRDSFDLLYTTRETIGKLRQAILQLAVQGRLVPQDPADEPAGKLLERVRAEKARLVKEKKIRKVDTLPPVTVEDAPYELSPGWEWVRLGHLLVDLRYGTAKHCDYSKSGAPVLRIPNIVKGTVVTDDMKFTELTPNEARDLALHPGDLLLIRSNGSETLVGRSAVVPNGLEGYAYAGYLVRARSLPDFIWLRYIYYSLESSYVRSQIEGPIRTTSGVKNINSTEISNLRFALPPLQEQKRVVEKVDRLMMLCDELEARLCRAVRKSETMTAAAVQGVLAA